MRPNGVGAEAPPTTASRPPCFVAAQPRTSPPPKSHVPRPGRALQKNN
ncbi:hypothetical protein [Lysobacter enzymogenes]